MVYLYFKCSNNVFYNCSTQQTHYKKNWNYIQPKSVCKTQNSYVKQFYIRITYEQESVCKTVVGKCYIRIQNQYVITYGYYIWIYLYVMQ